MADPNPATGSAGISGTVAQGASLLGLESWADADGVPTVTYQWTSDGAVIAGATANTFVPTQAEVGHGLSFSFTIVDNLGNVSSWSSPTAIVANIQAGHTGGASISGTPAQGQTLTAANTLADPDGMGTVGYQWKSDGAIITGATGSTITLGQAQVGHVITVTASYVDGDGQTESATSSATGAVANINDAHTGGASISGTATQGQTLTAANTLADADGMGTVSYQWKSDGADITGATGSAFTLTQAQVGTSVTVRASYTDGFGQAESATSSATGAVANVNDAPTGAVSIGGAAIEDQTLSVGNTLADADGLGAFSYQWTSDGANISGATAATFTLTSAQVGHAVAVTASYTDGFGHAESVTSSSTAAITHLNHAATGPVTVTGTATQGHVLSAGGTLTDPDGIGALSYQWAADGVDISGATGATYTLTQAEVGHAVSLTVSFTDSLGAAEAVTSSATATIANVNDAPTGAVTLSGSAVEGQTLTAANTLADADGLGTISYQWKSDGADITGATAATFNLTSVQVGHLVTVVASYTDGFGQAESVTSTAVTPAALPSAPPVAPGGVTTEHVEGGAILTGDGQDNTIQWTGDGEATLYGGAGNDAIVAGVGDDVLQGNTGDDSLSGGTGDDIVRGGQGDDFAQGGQGNDMLFGDLGDDILRGGQGNDAIQGGQGADLLFGDKGDDVMRGGQGDDVLNGGEGDDYLSGDLGSDTLTGGAGADIFHSFAGAGLDIITDFNRAEGDQIRLDPGTAYTLAQVGADTHIVMTGGELVLADVTLASLSAGWITA